MDILDSAMHVMLVLQISYSLQDAMDVCELMRATGLRTGHVGETTANATLSQVARMVPQTSRRITSTSGPAAAKRLLSALEVS